MGEEFFSYRCWLSFFFFKQKTAYDMDGCLEFRRVLFRSSKATTPILMLSGCAAINDRAARCAAASRSGATSLAPMLLDTSMARMTVPDARGTGSDAADRKSSV